MPLAFSLLVPLYHTSSNDHPLSSNIRDFTALPRSTFCYHSSLRLFMFVSTELGPSFLRSCSADITLWITALSRAPCCTQRVFFGEVGGLLRIGCFIVCCHLLCAILFYLEPVSVLKGCSTTKSAAFSVWMFYLFAADCVTQRVFPTIAYVAILACSTEKGVLIKLFCQSVLATLLSRPRIIYTFSSVIYKLM